MIEIIGNTSDYDYHRYRFAMVSKDRQKEQALCDYLTERQLRVILVQLHKNTYRGTLFTKDDIPKITGLMQELSTLDGRF